MLAVLALALLAAAGPVGGAMGVTGQTGVTGDVEVHETARVLAFSDDGARALVEEHVFADDGGVVVRYVVLDRNGAALSVDVSSSLGVLRMGRRVLDERVSRDDCRKAVAELDANVGKDFRNSVRVRAFGCASTVRDNIVEVLKSTPSPLLSAEETLALARDSGKGGTYFVNDNGPLVVVIRSVPGAYTGTVIAVEAFLRKDPRINKRWPDP